MVFTSASVSKLAQVHATTSSIPADKRPKMLHI
jgi:hypothetical protein